MNFKFGLSDGINEDTGDVYLILHITPRQEGGTKEAPVLDSGANYEIAFSASLGLSDIPKVLGLAAEREDEYGNSEQAGVYREIIGQIDKDGIEKMFQD